MQLWNLQSNEKTRAKRKLKGSTPEGSDPKDSPTTTTTTTTKFRILLLWFLQWIVKSLVFPFLSLLAVTFRLHRHKERNLSCFFLLAVTFSQ